MQPVRPSQRFSSLPARLVAASAVCALLAALSSCSQASNATDDAGVPADDAPAPFCATDPRAQSFTPGLAQSGKSGVLHAKLLDIAPAPTAKGDNAWTLALFDAAGAPVDGATISVKPFMPDHGHGSSITPLVTPAGSGKYGISRLNLFMPGLWQITFNVQTSAGAVDSIVYSFCVAS